MKQTISRKELAELYPDLTESQCDYLYAILPQEVDETVLSQLYEEIRYL